MATAFHRASSTIRIAGDDLVALAIDAAPYDDRAESEEERVLSLHGVRRELPHGLSELTAYARARHSLACAVDEGRTLREHRRPRTP